MPHPADENQPGTSLLEQPQVKAVWVARQMKAREAEFTETDSLRVFCGSWNVNCKRPTEDLRLWLDDEFQPDIYVLGFQEVDMSANALLLSNSKASGPWEEAVGATLGHKYVMLISKQLVGVFMCIFVKAEHIRHIQDLRFSIVGCGLLGVMGNKGGIAVRFNIYDSSFCFINSHLAAQLDHVERRNQDYHELVKRIHFAPNTTAPEINMDAVTDQSAEALTIWDHDHLFWLGDLNYRITLADAEVKQRIQAGDFEYLLKYDQLINQKRLGNAFSEWDEGPINFPPTYRFDAGTDRYDTSEKKRTPAYCDRIQWRVSPDVKLLRYSHTMDLRISDHKPVSALLVCKIKKVIPEKKMEAQLQVMRLLDQLENDNIPDAKTSTNTLLFADLRCRIAQKRSFTIYNTGQVVLNFAFIAKPGETMRHKPWISIKPDSGLLLPDESLEIEVTVNIDANTALALARGESLDDILVLHVVNGRDIFVLVTGNYLPSCFGATLDMLCNPTASLAIRQTQVQQPGPALRLPAELFRIVDYIFMHGMDEKGLFTTLGRPDEIELIRECLDNGIEFSKPYFDCDIHSMAETLIRFLGSLAEPVIPSNMYWSVIAAAEDVNQCKRLVQQLPRLNRNVFVYITAFLREVLAHADNNKLTAQDLAVLFSNELLRAPASAPQADRASEQSVQQRRAMFLLRFLS